MFKKIFSLQINSIIMNHILPSNFNKIKTLIIFGLFVMSCAFSYSQSPIEVMKVDTLLQKEKKASRFRLGAQIGYGYRLGRIDGADAKMANHLSRLKRNLSFGADIAGYANNYIGVGVKYNGIFAKSLTPDMPYIFYDGTIYNSLLSERVFFHIFAPFLATRFFVSPNKKHYVMGNVGIGLTLFRENMIMIDMPAKIAGTTFAFMTEVGYDFLVAKHLGIGFHASLYLSLLNSANYTLDNRTQYVKFAQPENMSHVDITVGLRIY
jgi:hypothetical protein